MLNYQTEEIIRLISNAKLTITSADPKINIYVGGSAALGNLTWVKIDNTLILLSDIDLYVKPSNFCLSQLQSQLNIQPQYVRYFEISPSSKISIRCVCDSCKRASLEAAALWKHCERFGMKLELWEQFQPSTSANSIPMLPLKVGLAHCYKKSISFNTRNKYWKLSSFYQYIKFCEQYVGFTFDYKRYKFSRIINSDDFEKYSMSAMDVFASNIHKVLKHNLYLEVLSNILKIKTANSNTPTLDIEDNSNIYDSLCYEENSELSLIKLSVIVFKDSNNGNIPINLVYLPK